MNAPLAQAAGDQAALIDLLAWLNGQGYAFVTPSPDTHAIVLAREPGRPARDLRDVFGWSRPFGAGAFPEAEARLARAGLVEAVPGGYRSRVRVSALDGRLYLHSPYPTDEADSVFLGPDSYRFARFIRDRAGAVPASARVFDIGTGAGVGALTAKALLPGAEVLAGDVNPGALRFAFANAAHAGLEIALVGSDGLEGAEGRFDLILANPPYIADEGARAYRHGGGMLGAELSLEWAKDAVRRLRTGGRFLLYTGSAIVAGRDAVCAELADLAAREGLHLAYEELDPDVFGSELTRPAYAEAERIAVVGAVLTRR